MTYQRWTVPSELEHKMAELAADLRHRSTPSETIMWEALRNRKFHGLKFRRQAPIGVFVVDFLCSDEMLVIEIDGPIHDQHQERDRVRQEILESLGLRVLRFSADAVEHHLTEVLAEIRLQVTEDQSCPLPTFFAP